MSKNREIQKVSVIMGSQSDYSIMKESIKVLKRLDINFEKKIISAHRTPKRMFNYAINAEKQNVKVIIAGAGGSAHLPGMVASLTHIPVIGVPIESKKLKGLDSLLSIVQMPKGIPVATVAIGKDGAINAALLAGSILSTSNLRVKKKLLLWRKKQSKSVKKFPK
ncbi:MAG: 5-(carboxyamino)imidazole ribonucleotide mutase [Candidatus Pelagibacter sp. TMED118]|nr:MAG: 5-(carboxyamino)imidazole ribonucleotide mutase [Candidatus Pelagibacter sp. TMED118]|tara:strand:+ start:1510 stop:2004 length:495 start_codon:yes stop_codon:yes gene_type:complete